MEIWLQFNGDLASDQWGFGIRSIVANIGYCREYRISVKEEENMRKDEKITNYSLNSNTSREV
jgi:hypothetical protein